MEFAFFLYLLWENYDIIGPSAKYIDNFKKEEEQ